MTTAIVYDDGRGRLGPMTDLRAVFEVRTGAMTTLERLADTLATVAEIRVTALWAPNAVATLTRERTGLAVNDPASLPTTGDVFLVNGRCVLPPDDLDELEVNEAIVEAGTNEVIACRLAAKHVHEFLNTFTLPSGITTHAEREPALIHWAWDVIRMRDEALEIDLALMAGRDTQELPPGVVLIGDQGLTISPTATVYPMAVLDCENGPIVIDDDAVVRPLATIVGPAYIGKGSTVLDHALIKAHTAIGPVCKVAGEIGGTIFQGYANKGHDGHLGDSWVGEWVNLGAATTNSNLLNTYSEVIATMPAGYVSAGERQRTALQFLGAILGDHVKTAIGTRLMTGSIIGTGAMLATTAAPPTSVAAFSWLTDERSQRYRLNKFEEVMRAMMSRRKIEPSSAYLAQLHHLYESLKSE